MTAPEAPSARSGVAYVLAATVVAGGLGYLIQALVPVFTTSAQYVAFSVYWSAVYLVVAAIAGVQQEVTRASRPRRSGATGRSIVIRFGWGAAAASVVVVGVSAFAWAPAAFGAHAIELAPPLVAAAGAYALVATMSGVFYGAREWGAVAGMTVTDSVLRVVTVGASLILGGSVVALGWAVALPFALSVLILWLVRGRRAVGEISLDATTRELARHSISTVGAALATGVMISGLPLLLGTTARGLGDATLAALILVITLTRAPLVIPLLALQSFLVVLFRDDPGRAVRRTVLWSAGLVGATAVLSCVGAFVGPWVVALLYGDRFGLEPAVYAGVIASAGMTALLCLTGPAALAAGRHGRYVAGWALSSVVLVAALVSVPAQVWSVVVVLAVSPVPGALIHLSALRAAPAASR